MKNELEGAIEVLLKRIEQLSTEITDIKKTVNSLCRVANKAEMFQDSDLAGNGYSGIQSIKPSQFYGKSPTVAAREYLDIRTEATTVDEIIEALRVGGFDFDAQGWNETMRLKNLSISFSKNTAIFHRLPNGRIGLTKWYPNVKTKKTVTKLTETDNNNADENVSEPEISDNGKTAEDRANAFSGLGG